MSMTFSVHFKFLAFRDAERIESPNHGTKFSARLRGNVSGNTSSWAPFLWTFHSDFV